MIRCWNCLISRRAEARNLQPGGRLFGAEGSGDVELASFFAAKFSAGRFRDAARRNEFDTVGREAEPGGNFVSDGSGNCGATRGVGFPRFRDHDEFFRAGTHVLQAERDDAAFADAIGAAGELFDFVRIEIAATLDDDVLDAAGDEDFAVGAIGTIAGIDPSKFAVRGLAFREECLGGGGIVEVARSG